MRQRHELTGPLVIAALLTGCNDQRARPDTARSPGSSDSSASSTDKWLGQWNGPEGTFLRLEGGKGQYQITIQDLDGPRTFQGATVDGVIWFERNGQKESIRATNGAETGMKWLQDKTNCLTIKSGEGYCRD